MINEFWPNETHEKYKNVINKISSENKSTGLLPSVELTAHCCYRNIKRLEQYRKRVDFGHQLQLK